MKRILTNQQGSRVGLRLSAVIYLALIGCSPPPSTKPIVLVTVPPQQWFVEQLAGDLVHIHVLVPPGVHPASYTPGQESMRFVSQAGIYLALGHPHFPFEVSWMERITTLNPLLKIVRAIPPRVQPRGDPHFWTSPRGARALVASTYAGLLALLPEHRLLLKANRDSLLRHIQTIESEFTKLLMNRRGERFYVVHPAWGALARDFDLEQVAIEEEGKEPSPARLAELIQQARTDSVQWIMIQPQFSQQGGRTIAEAIGARLLVLDPLSSDWSQSMEDIKCALAKSLVEPH